MSRLLKYFFRTVSAEDIKQAVDKWYADKKPVTMVLLEKLHGSNKCKAQLKKVDLSHVYEKMYILFWFMHVM